MTATKAGPAKRPGIVITNGSVQANEPLYWYAAQTLAKAGYVAVDKAFVGKKPQTTVTATATGRAAFARHVATLQEIIAASEGTNDGV